MPPGRVALFAFSKEASCFIHVLLNALDFADKGWTARIVVEGGATTIIPEVARPDHALNSLFVQALERDLFDGACKACSTQLGVADKVQKAGLRLLHEMKGHPSMAWYRQMGHEIITF
jgi:hypothetical protein